MPEFDAMVLAISAPSISGRALRAIETEALNASDLPARFVRLEEEGANLFDAMDSLRDEGCSNILVRPIGFPFPENLKHWIPGVLASWLERSENASVHLSLSSDCGDKPDFIQKIIKHLISDPDHVTDIDGVASSLGKPGWNQPPDYDYHLLVCVGPRCQVRGSTPFLQRLQSKIRIAGLQKRCLITRTNCIYPCNQGPVLALYPHGDWYRLPEEASLQRFVDEALVNSQPVQDFIFHHARLAGALHNSHQTHDEKGFLK